MVGEKTSCTRVRADSCIIDVTFSVTLSTCTASRLIDTTSHLHIPTPNIIYSRLYHFVGQGTEIGRGRYSEAELTDIKLDAERTTNPMVRFSHSTLQNLIDRSFHVCYPLLIIGSYLFNIAGPSFDARQFRADCTK